MNKHEFDVSPRVRRIRLIVYLIMDSIVPAPPLAFVLWVALYKTSEYPFQQRLMWGVAAMIVAMWATKVAFTLRSEKRKARAGADNEPAPYDGSS